MVRQKRVSAGGTGRASKTVRIAPFKGSDVAATQKDDNDCEDAFNILPEGDGDDDDVELPGVDDASDVSDDEDDGLENADESAEPILNLEGPEEAEEFMRQPQDLVEVKQKIDESLRHLANWEAEKTPTSSRGDVIARLVIDAAFYYGYSNDLAEYLINLLGPLEAVSLFEANEQARPTTLRVNMLKSRKRDISQVLTKKGVVFDSVGRWTNVGLKVFESQVPLGATPEYLAGQYILQSASSLLPVMALAPQPGEKVLDMAAAPGGKATHIGQLMKNEGVLFCNDSKRDRTSALIANLHRLGISNSVVTCVDGRKLRSILPSLDRVLLDAPCTGSGIISKDPSVKVKRGPKEFVEQSTLQKELLATAVDLVDANSKTGGYIVYSTCSISVEENEAVVDHVLKTHNVTVVPMDVSIGCPGICSFRGQTFCSTLKEARRIYPHKHNMDGFFVVKLKKTSNNPVQRVPKDRSRQQSVVWGPEQWTHSVLNHVKDGYESDDGHVKKDATPGKRKKKPILVSKGLKHRSKLPPKKTGGMLKTARKQHS